MNKAKGAVQQAIAARKDALQRAELEAKLAAETIDVTLPGRRIENGGLHPVTRTVERIEKFFGELGFNTESGPEIEDAFHNFDALNIASAITQRVRSRYFLLQPRFDASYSHVRAHRSVRWKMANHHSVSSHRPCIP
ncbi:hypothetical protein P4S64_18650 [Vibrio sp. M60_M31a]